jgi:hypothetical protein
MNIIKVDKTPAIPVYPKTGKLTCKNNQQSHPVEADAPKSLYLGESSSYRNRIELIILPIGLVIVLIGPALLVSDKLQVFALLMLNNALGAILGFIKYRLTPLG